MNRNRMIGLCLTLLLTALLIGGPAFEASAQQPTAPSPPAAAPSDSRPAAPAPDGSAPSSSAPQSQTPAMQPAPSTSVQTDTRTEKTERIVEREPGTFLGVNPTVALMVGAALLIVIVFAFVSMSRRKEEVHRTHHTHTGI
jgi:hypothetical protein